MSKYTTEVRYICETYSGLSESVGYDKIDEVLNGSWDKVFDFDFPMFDDNYRKALCIKILKHFYTREIGEETVGLWKLRLNTRMNEIMPYYNQLYESETLKINPLYTFNYQKTHKDSGGDVRTIEETGTNSESVEGSNDGTRTSKEDSTQNNESTNSGSNNRVSNVTNNGKSTSADSGNDIITGDVSTGNTTQGKTETTVSGNVTSNKTENLKDRFSDTPQGGLDGIENNTYLTNARLNDNTVNQTDTNNGSEQSVNNEVVTGQSNSNQKTEYGKSNESTNTIEENGTITDTVSGSSTNKSTNSKTESVTDAFTNKSSRSGESGKNVSDSITTTREYIESVMGSNGTSDSKLLMEYRETFLNVDMMVINELNDLFMNIW